MEELVDVHEVLGLQTRPVRVATSIITHTERSKELGLQPVSSGR